MRVGDHIEIQYRQKNAQFRVIWITAGMGSERQIGAECLEPGKQVWGEHFPEQEDEYERKESPSWFECGVSSEAISTVRIRPSRPMEGVVANEDVRSMTASVATDALKDCKRRVEWFKNFDPKSHRHISHLKKRIAALEKRLRALKA
jgi:hypothetical protein